MTALSKEAAALTREALEDDWCGLHEENAELRAEVQALKAERDSLKAQVGNLSSDNQGAVIGRLHQQVITLKGAHKDAMAKAAKETRRANFIAKERDELRESIQRQEITL